MLPKCGDHRKHAARNSLLFTKAVQTVLVLFLTQIMNSLTCFSLLVPRIMVALRVKTQQHLRKHDDISEKNTTTFQKTQQHFRLRIEFAKHLHYRLPFDTQAMFVF